MKPFRHILHVTDPSLDESTRCRAVELAIQNKASLTLMSVVEPLPRAIGLLNAISDTDGLQQAVAADRRRQLLEIASEYSCTGVPLDVVVTIGNRANEVVRQVISGKHDLLVKSAEGAGVVNRLLGSVSQSLMRIAPCPVWLLKPKLRGTFDCVVAAVDATSDDEATANLNHNILELSDSIAKRESAALHVVSAWDIWMETPLRMKMGDSIIDGMADELEASVRRRVDDLIGKTVTVGDVRKHISRGAAADKIRELVKHLETDLLVMGTQCRTGVAGFFIGNTAESVLSDVKCSVLTVKPEGFVSPIERDLERTVIRENAEPIFSIFSSQHDDEGRC
ncbi:Universal stress protein E [Stieleria maiorica]|uniref:Universal stress protein E n=1 Tax=Stieleria maiorica TaxID=2795974 RepID=A0A5B9MBB6_9BACT|nr:universal stress protein [Stieleria maiorica]QEF97829.1 Universal stress protein E [Stieleria maiorica]